MKLTNTVLECEENNIHNSTNSYDRMKYNQFVLECIKWMHQKFVHFYVKWKMSKKIKKKSVVFVWYLNIAYFCNREKPKYEKTNLEKHNKIYTHLMDVFSIFWHDVRFRFCYLYSPKTVALFFCQLFQILRCFFFLKKINKKR